MRGISLKSRAAYSLAVLCTLLWGTAFPFIKRGYEEFNIAENDIGAKLLFAGFRFALAGIMVLAVLLVKERRAFLPAKNELPPIAAVGGVQTFAQYLFTYIGIGFTSGANTSVITACASFITVLAAPIFFKADSLTAVKLSGCALGFGGVLLINGGAAVSADTMFGDSMIFVSTICAASGNIISKKAATGINPVKVTGYQLVFGSLLLIAAGLVCGGRLSFVSAECALILLWLALVSAVAFTIWTALLKHHPASRISVFNLLVPVFGTLLSGVMLGENVFKISTAFSLILISAGIVLVNLSPDRRGKLEN